MGIYFYKVKEPYGCFSNFSPHGFKLDGHWWPTSEHFFQAQKFVDTEHYHLIRKAKTPKQAATLGRDRKRPLRSDWEEIKDDIMHKAVFCKFQNHPDIREILLSTKNELIIEDSPIDYYWGCGADGSGNNRLGQILMQVREDLQCQEEQKT